MEIVLLIALLAAIALVFYIQWSNKNSNSSDDLLVQLTNNLSNEIQSIRKEEEKILKKID